MHETFDTAGPVRLRVRLGAGEVEVRAAEAGRTTVDVEPLRDDDATRDALGRLTPVHEVHDGVHEVRVELPDVKGGFLRRGPKVMIRVHCPPGTDLDVTASSADLAGAGRLGSARVKTASGDVSLEQLAGSVDVATASGDVEVREAGGSASVKTASGDVSLGRVAGPITVAAVSGDVSVGDVLGDASVTTVSGDVAARGVRAGAVRLQSISGDVEVVVRPGLRVWLDVASVSGSTHSELGALDAPAGEGDAAVELRIRTVSGDVRIAREEE